MENPLAPIKSEEVKLKIIERCGENPDPQGITCTNCGAREVYADRKDPRNIDKWFWMIRAYKVDDWSDCRNCKEWFQS